MNKRTEIKLRKLIRESIRKQLSENDENVKTAILTFWNNEYNGVFSFSGSKLLYKNNKRKPIAGYDFLKNTAKLNNLRDAMPMVDVEYRKWVKEDFQKTLDMMGEEINID